jgi:hypothetical protein
MARTHLTRRADIDRIKSNKAAGDRVIAKLDEHDTAIDALEGGTTSSIVTIHPVRGASTENVSNLADFDVEFDGLTLVAGDRVLLKNQSTGSQNGIYVVGTVAGGAAALTRATDFDAAAEVKPNTLVSVAAGTLGANTLWQLAIAAAPTIGNTALTFVQLYNATQVTAAGLTIAKKTVTVNDEDAGMTGASYAVNIGTALPANAIVLAHEIAVVEQFAGEADTTITIGGTAAAAIVASTDLDALGVGSYLGTLGVHPVGKFSSQQLVATFAATALQDLSAGQCVITVWYSVLA